MNAWLCDRTEWQNIYNARPKCGGYFEIVVPELKAKPPVQAINGRHQSPIR